MPLRAKGKLNLARILALVVTVFALVGVVRLTAPATGEPGVARQLAFLRAALDDGAAERAQELFPEGQFFLNVLYGLSWVELGMRSPAAERATAVREAAKTLQVLDSPASRAPFSSRLTPRYGVFYRGWTNWLRAGLLRLQPAHEWRATDLHRFKADSAELAAAFTATSSPYLEAYAGQAWPVDSTVAIASLRMHDVLLPAKYEAVNERWLNSVRARLDLRTGLLPHRADADTGAPAEVARGSSQSLVQRFLPDIDPAFAADQYLRFRDQFVTSPLSLGPFVREFPEGMDGAADIDSGPLPLGISFSATVVTIGAAQVHHDDRLASALANLTELVGVPVGTPWSKRYGFGLLPIGDAFLAWSKLAQPWVAVLPPSPAPNVSLWWRFPLLLMLLLVGVVPWARPLSRVIRNRRGNGGSAGAAGLAAEVRLPD